MLQFYPKGSIPRRATPYLQYGLSVLINNGIIVIRGGLKAVKAALDAMHVLRH